MSETGGGIVLFMYVLRRTVIICYILYKINKKRVQARYIVPNT
nr:MAG TPA_asm: hypothetical protein [Caudoviricetes sp.]